MNAMNAIAEATPTAVEDTPPPPLVFTDSAAAKVAVVRVSSTALPSMKSSTKTTRRWPRMALRC